MGNNYNTGEIVEVDIEALVSMEINPRTIKDDKYRKLQQSILTDPDFMKVRPILVNRVEGALQVYAGTQRMRACADLGWKKVPCIIDDNIHQSKIKERMLKDNVHAGEWDTVKLSEFDTTTLDTLDISSMLNKVNWQEGELKEDTGKKDKSEANKKEEFGGHHFIVVHGSEDEKAAFALLLEDIREDDKRPEDIIIEKAKQLLANES